MCVYLYLNKYCFLLDLFFDLCYTFGRMTKGGSFMDPTQKRRNPFDELFEASPIETVPKQQPVVQPEPQKSVRQPVYQAPKTVKTQTPRRGFVEEMSGREKYTSTMEKNLRRQIKIACVNRGIMFSEFIEEACREKLQREGMI
jgi:hypothetical protein